jgi:dTDP-4-amino-4,6-dideoxygalactose transaminase
MTKTRTKKSTLAILGGSKSVTMDAGDIFTWPIVTKEHEDAVINVLRTRNMSGWDLTKKFETEYAKMVGVKYGLGCSSGTASLQSAMFGLGWTVGTEVIVPSLTYWASVAQLLTLGSRPVFADIDPENLCIDPKDIERKITPRTKGIVVVHYAAMPADMDAIMTLAKKYNLKVLEDCSHAHGALYKGKPVGTFGDAAGFSLMSGKSFAMGEAGILLTNDQLVYERAILFAHYERHDAIELPEVKRYAGLPCGGYKYRMHQASSAFGLVQLKKFPEQMAEIDKAMNYFCDLLEDVKGVYPYRPAKGSGNTKGGWYFPLAKYVPEELDGLSVTTFAKAVQEEGSPCGAGANKPLHLHPLFYAEDIYGHGKPTSLAYMPASEKQTGPQKLPITESIGKKICMLPWFKHFDKGYIEQCASAYKKVVENHKDLLDIDKGDPADLGGWSSSRH